MKRIFLIFFLLSQTVLAAPVPGTSTSYFIKSNENFFQSKYGFSISSKNTEWKLSSLPIGSKNIQALFVGKKLSHHIRPSLTVRTNKLIHKKSFNWHITKWKTDYHKFGFRLLKTKKVRLNKNIFFLIDLLDQNSHKKMRQIITLKNGVAVVLSCRSHSKEFKQTIKNCNKIFKNFNWSN